VTFRLPSHAWRRCGFALAVTTALGLLAAAPAAVTSAAEGDQAAPNRPDEAQPLAQRLGMLVRVELPITERTVRRVRGFIDRALARAREKQRVPVLDTGTAPYLSAIQRWRS